MDRLIGLYAALSAIALVFPHRPDHWPVLAVIHLLLAGLLLPAEWILKVVVPIGALLPRLLATFIRDWHPLLLLPYFYGEASTLNTSIHGGHYFDPLIIHWEQVLFGAQPALTFAAVAPSFWLSEMLHVAYFSYYPVVYGPPLILWVMAIRNGGVAGRGSGVGERGSGVAGPGSGAVHGRAHGSESKSFERRRQTHGQVTRDTFHALLFPLMVTFVLCTLSFVWFPVEGPRYHFPPVPIEEGPMSNLVRAILESGSSRGTAFPSSHAALAVAQTVLVARYLPKLYVLTFVLTVGMCFGAVYGGYHYAIDMAAGVLVGLVGVLIADRIQEPAPAIRWRERRAV